MIIDTILERKDSLHYDSKTFYNACMMYGEAGENITRAMDGGIEADVKDALKQYIQDNVYNPLICDYIDRVNWLRGTEPTVEKAAAEEFNAGCRAREEAAAKMEAPEGYESVFAYECGVLLSPEDEDFDYYSNNNPELPYGFYDEDQGMFLRSELGKELYVLRDYVKNGVDKTYAVISFQGCVDVGGTEHESLLKGEFDVGQVSYTFFRNPDEIVYSCCKMDGKLVECFLEKEIRAFENQKLTLEDKDNKVATRTVKARDLKPGMRTETGVVIGTKKDYSFDKWGIEVNCSLNGHAVFDWFPEDKDVTVFEDFQPEIKASIDKQINVAENKKSNEKCDADDLRNNLEL